MQTHKHYISVQPQPQTHKTTTALAGSTVANVFAFACSTVLLCMSYELDKDKASLTLPLMPSHGLCHDMKPPNELYRYRQITNTIKIQNTNMNTHNMNTPTTNMCNPKYNRVYT